MDNNSHIPKPEQIGPYKILDVLGEGGMGTVFRARQEQPVSREVAVKVIKLGMNTLEVMTRFDLERQTLALMNHSSIAAVFDAGTTEQGQPYFVMEYVKGRTLTQYCDHHYLTIRLRIKLFIQVLNAIQHAHQRGIIHRDIKPSNVLVTTESGRAVPKIIDFGIARAADQYLDRKTAYPSLGMAVGTLEYMSPEQAESGTLDIDTRSDIYSLGVLLYELLTGAHPFDGTSFRKKRYTEALKLIQEVDPSRPSTRLDTHDNRLPEIAKRRQTNPSSFKKLLCGDLDWIVMKAMEKDRSRRYDSAGALTADLERFLADEPVGAGPPGIGYRMGKFVKRNKILVGAASMILVLLFLGAAAMIYGTIQAGRERDKAVIFEKEAVRRGNSAKEALQEVSRKEKRNRETNRYLQSLLVDVNPDQADPLESDNELDFTLAEELFSHDPVILAGIIIGKAAMLEFAGYLEYAEKELKHVLKRYEKMPDMPGRLVAKTYGDLGDILRREHKYTEADFFLRIALEHHRKYSGNDSREVADTLMELIEVLLVTKDQPSLMNKEIKDLWNEAIRIYSAILGESDRITIRQVCAFGVWLESKGDASAEEVLTRGVEAGRASVDWSSYFLIPALESLASIYQKNELDDLIIKTFHEIIHIHGHIYGVDHPVHVQKQLDAAYGMSTTEDFVSLPVLREAVAKGREILPRGDVHLVRAMVALVRLLNIAHHEDPFFDTKELISLTMEEQAHRRTHYGPDNPTFIRYLHGAYKSFDTNQFNKEDVSKILSDISHEITRLLSLQKK